MCFSIITLRPTTPANKKPAKTTTLAASFGRCVDPSLMSGCITKKSKIFSVHQSSHSPQIPTQTLDQCTINAYMRQHDYGSGLAFLRRLRYWSDPISDRSQLSCALQHFVRSPSIAINGAAVDQKDQIFDPFRNCVHPPW